MKKHTNELFFQVVSLLLAVIITHTIYVTWVLPNADASLRLAQEKADAGGEYIAPRNFFIVMKDFEQETEVMLGLWALAIMGYKLRTTMRESDIFASPLVSIAEGTRVLPEDSGALLRPLQSLSEEQQDMLLPRVLRTALARFQVTASVQSASDAAKGVCDAEDSRLDSEQSMVRYITWAIPSIGFIGTVRGIGGALAEAHEAIKGNIAGVTANLGTAFNSTLVALLISMVVMFIMHQLQLMQERLVLNSYTYCEDRLLRFLKSD